MKTKLWTQQHGGSWSINDLHKEVEGPPERSRWCSQGLLGCQLALNVSTMPGHLEGQIGEKHHRGDHWCFISGWKPWNWKRGLDQKTPGSQPWVQQTLPWLLPQLRHRDMIQSSQFFLHSFWNGQSKLLLLTWLHLELVYRKRKCWPCIWTLLVLLLRQH